MERTVRPWGWMISIQAIPSERGRYSRSEETGLHREGKPGCAGNEYKDGKASPAQSRFDPHLIHLPKADSVQHAHEVDPVGQPAAAQRHPILGSEVQQ